MLKKRIIPCLDIQNGQTVKGIQFKEIKEVGDPVKLAQRYIQEGADEIVFLDITATIEKRQTLIDLVKRLAKEINIPFTIGGGIKKLEDARLLLQSGADKVSLNSAAVKRPKLITQIAKVFGSQSVVVAIDTKYIDGQWYVYTSGGRTPTNIKTIDWAKQAEALGAGEILLTSMNNDGTKNGFALDIVEAVNQAVNIPVIASGGAGKKEDFKDLFKKTETSAALAASIFHYQEVNIDELKPYLKNQQIAVR